MKEIKAIVQPFMLDKVLGALREHEELPGVTVSQVLGWGRSRAADSPDNVREGGFPFARKTKLEIVVDDDAVDGIVEIIVTAARTGRPGDGKIFVVEVADAVHIRTGRRAAETS